MGKNQVTGNNVRLSGGVSSLAAKAGEQDGAPAWCEYACVIALDSHRVRLVHRYPMLHPVPTFLIQSSCIASKIRAAEILILLVYAFQKVINLGLKKRRLIKMIEKVILDCN